MWAVNQYYRTLNRVSGPNPNAFIMTFALGASDSITLPLILGGTYSFDVDWGDGTTNTITAYNQAERIHTYTGLPAGDYVVTIIGTCTIWNFASVTTSRTKLKLISQWGDTGLTILGFASCTALNSIASDLKFYGTSLSAGFQNCTALTSLPTDLFKYCTSVTNFVSIFRSCTNLASINASLFQYNTLVTTFANAFRFCTALTSLPTDLFRYNTAVTTFTSVFQNCSLLISIPTDLFNYNNSVTNYSSAFISCPVLATSVTSIVSGMTMTAVTTTNQMFSGCTSLTGNGQDLIDKPKAGGYTVGTGTTTGSYRTFYNCTTLTDYATISVNYK